MEEVRIAAIDFDEDDPLGFEEREVPRAEDCFQYLEKPTLTWINIVGVHDRETVRKIGQPFGLHKLTIEDLSTRQRPRWIDWKEYGLLVLRMLYYVESYEVVNEQVTIILGSNFVLTFQERKEDVFDKVRERIRKREDEIRSRGAGYLVSQLVGAIVDRYDMFVEEYAAAIQRITRRLVEEIRSSKPDPKTMLGIHFLKENMFDTRVSVRPLRSEMTRLLKTGAPLFGDHTVPHLEDTSDQIVRIVEELENQEYRISSMVDTYLTNINTKMNDIVKVLTIVAFIFVPLTFVTGVFGMEVLYTQDFHVNLAFLVALGVMGGVGILTYLLFRRFGLL